MKTPYRRTWWLPPSQRAERDEQIREGWAMGLTYEQLAEEFGLTKQRIWQVVNHYKPKRRSAR